MRKHILLLSILFCVHLSFSQNPEIKTDLPVVISPSPTVAALMKFEEVPVSNYTGVPDISIPLFSTGTHSKDINLDISLKYHSGVGANEVAGDVGLGWSLFAGGTVSRTVRGLPDEILVMDGGQSIGKVGLYHTTILNHNNYYYESLDNFSQFAYNNPYIANKYIWDIVETGKFDTEHDLWQFNFMGFSGRFYIEKNAAGNLVVKPLDDYRIKIINNYTTIGNNDYIPSGFTIYDDKGYKYEFDVIETTKNSQTTHSIYGIAEDETHSLSDEKVFRSAFQLSKIFDNNNNILIEYLFNPTSDDYIECSNNSSITANDYSQTNEWGGIPGFELIKYYNCFREFEPTKLYVNSKSKINVRKIETINVLNKCKIEFKYLHERKDTNIPLVNKALKIDQIIIKSLTNINDTVTIKKFKLDYEYSNVINNRMILKGLKEKNANNNINNKYEFYYRSNDSTGYNVGKDYWGYFNLTPSCFSVDVNFSNEPSPSFSTTDILQKIKYPTGGCAIFNFESNEYSYIQDEEVNDFDENQNNFHQTYYTPLPPVFNSTTNTYNIPISTVKRKVRFTPSILLLDLANAVDTFILQKYNGQQWVTVRVGLHCISSNLSCCIDFTLEANVQYKIFRSYLYNGPAPNATIGIQYFEKNQTQDIKKFLYGGGNRIKQIGYFEQDVPQTFYEDQTPSNLNTLKKEKKYKYNWPNDINKSSGSLAFVKPLFKYQNSIKINTTCPEPPHLSSGVSLVGVFNFTTYTTFNNLNFIKTQGADVGYKYVTVFETGNGSTDFEYTSPINEPEVLLFINRPPFLPTKNFDYKRGLLINETVKNQQGNKLQEINYNYSFENFEVKYGVRRYKPNDCGFGGSYFGSYSGYIPYVQLGQGPIGNLNGFNKFNSSNLCGYPLEYTQPYPLIQAYGWAKLSAKTTKNYFYPNGGTTPNIVQTNETYDYNSLNKKISESTITNSKGEILKSKYFYHTGNSTFSQNRISEIERIESYRGNDILSTSKINYTNTFAGNASFLPQTIQTSKGTQSLENRVSYTKYDEFGNPLELEQEGGTKVCYIWGYNKTQPIAKIENIAYADIPATLITNIENITSSQTATAAQIESALDSLQSSTDSNMQKAMITTYSYYPLVGVKTITDPKGDKITYEYDTFNRLKAVYDNLGNKLLENDYHYRPQIIEP